MKPPFATKCMLVLCMACSCWPANSFGQDTTNMMDTLTPQMVIRACATLREQVIGEIVETLIDFNLLCDSLAAISAYPEEYDKFRSSFFEAIMHLDDYSAWLLLSNTMPGSIRFEKGSGQIVKSWIQEHIWQLMQFQFLISARVIEDKSPYKLTNLRSFWDELSAYDLHKNQKFIDVGGGVGTISFMLSETGIPLTIYLTEIDEDMLTFLRQKGASGNIGNDSTKVIVIKGAKDHLGLEDTIQVDRILMREVFHHLKDKEAIMTSIKHHLKPDGQLIIVESTIDLEPNRKYRCVKAMESDKIEIMIKEFGFNIEEKRRVEDAYVWRLKPAP